MRDTSWTTYLKESGFWDTYNGCCECASCIKIRKGFEGWKQKPEESSITTLQREVESLRAALNLAKECLEKVATWRIQPYCKEVKTALEAIKDCGV